MRAEMENKAAKMGLREEAKGQVHRGENKRDYTGDIRTEVC